MTTASRALLLFLILQATSFSALCGNTFYVSTNSPLNGPGTAWFNAFHDIQSAVNVAASNDLVLVTNGVYSTGGRPAPGASLTNRVCLTNAVTVCSVNGPDVTFIVGAADSASTNGPTAVRCAYLTNGACVVGFTLTNGHTGVSGWPTNSAGGGALLMSGGTVSNCVLAGNQAFQGGGGAVLWAGGVIWNSRIQGNGVATNNGGGAYVRAGGALRNCLVWGNDAASAGTQGYGGGVYFSQPGGLAENCTIVSNTARSGGGVYADQGGTNRNNIIYNNSATVSGSNWAFAAAGRFEYCCTTPLSGIPGGIGCISNNPAFLDPDGDFHPAMTSACVNAGTNLAWTVGAVDLDGRCRWVNTNVDIGCYERMQSAGSGSPTHYVSLVGSNRWPFTNLTAAARLIQDAVDTASDGDTVFVTNGTYVLTDQISVTNGIRVKGVTWPAPTIVNGNGANRCFWLSHSNAIVDRVTITNGCSSFGGGVFISAAGAVLNCTVSGNRAGDGGGIWIDGGGLVTNCTIAGNATTNRDSYQSGGGGVYLNGGGTVLVCTISGNSTPTNLQTQGGGIYAYSEGTIERCTICSNTAYLGGGVFCGYGGTLRNCLIFKNRAAAQNGGGVALDGGGVIQNCTVSSNASSLAGGGMSLHAGGTVWNSIVYFNSPEGDVNSDAGGAIGWSCVSSTNGDGGWSRCTTNDPGFADRAAGNYRLRWWSPCVDSGTNLTALGLTNDLAGVSRPLDGNADGATNFDMGAYEFNLKTEAPPFVAITNADAVVDYGVTNVALGGTNNDNVVGLLTWSNVLTGATGTASAAPAWTLNLPGLECRDNVIVVSGSNLAGQVASDTTRVTRVVASDSGDSPAHYAATNGAGVWPFTNWATAARCVQAAVDAAAAGDTVWVSNGVYAAGGALTPGYSLLNRVVITNTVTLQSVNGWSNTFLVGQGPLGNTAVRCAYCSNGVVAGFTLTNGFAQGNGGGAFGGGTLTNCTIVDNHASSSGGGVYGMKTFDCLIALNESSSGGGIYGGQAVNCRIEQNNAWPADGGGAMSARLIDCTINSNWAWRSGGGASVCDLLNCIVADNSGGYEYGFHGGGVAYGTATNCIIVNNTEGNGLIGGAFQTTLCNCTIVSNLGGAFQCPVYNSVVYYNESGALSNMMYSVGVNCCTYPNLGDAGTVTNAPQFVDLAGGDFHLQPSSPCINKGSNVYAQVAADFDGTPRILGGRVDIGCYEFFAVSNTLAAPVVTAPFAVPAGSNLTFVVTNWAASITISGAKATSVYTVNPWTTNGIAQTAAGAAWTNAGQALSRAPTGATNTWIYRAMSTNLQTFSGSNTTLVIVNYLLTPQIVISDPHALVSYETTNVTIDGTQSGAVGQMRWTNSLTGHGNAFAATNPWSISSIALTVGVNVITVSATNILGDAASNRVSLTRTAYSPVHYVSLAGNGAYPFTNWTAAATGIQAAVDACGAGDTVLVGDGTYWLTNQVSITNAVTVQSENGAAAAIVNGNYPAYTNRCFYLGHSNAVLDGFTLTNGWAEPASGGGVWLGAAATVRRCIIAGNRAGNGGGVYSGSGGKLWNCVVAGNTATNNGGGIYYGNSNCVACNCLIKGNTTTQYGGGVYLNNTGDPDVIMNCTIVSNSAGIGAGGAAAEVLGYLRNTIVYFNGPDNWHGVGGGDPPAFLNCCTWPESGSMCVSNNPQFLDQAGANYRLRYGSPCIDRGVNLSPQGLTNDLDSVARPIDGNFDDTGAYDMGCYEYDPQTTDSDGDGMKDADERTANTDPTNAASFFRVTAASNLPPQRVYFAPSSTGRLYSLQSRLDLMSGGWSNVPGQMNISDAPVWLTDTNAAMTTRFYRVNVGMP